MSPSAATQSSDLMEVIAARRSQARMRAGLALGLTLGFGAITGWAWAMAWFCIYAGLQAFEYFVLARRTPPPWAAVALLVTNSVVFGVFALAGPLNDGAFGLCCWICLLCGGQLNSALTSQKSRLAFLASSTPFALYLAATPVVALWLGAKPHQAVSIAAAAALIVIFTHMIWRAAARALTAESEARALAEAADAAKSAFVAMVSHELRTPISAILAGAVEAKSARSAKVRDSNLELISSSARMMRTLLDDLLDMSKIEAGRMGVEITAFDLRRLMLETVRFWAPVARRGNLAFRLEGAHSLPAWVEGDPTRIRQVLNNLLSNALKFTESGAITLRMAAEPCPDRTFALILEVIDTGPGMTEEQIGGLFTAYGQLSDSVARTHGGTGLGLNISRELARLMGGDLVADSAPGQGATFRLSLNLSLGEAESPADTALQEQTGLSVLIIDDHEINRRAFTLILQGAVDPIVTAENGQDALAILARQPFDVVLMDLNMPKMGGLDCTRALRAAAGPNQTTPVIALTASAARSEIDVCLAVGMNAFVMKPVEAAELFGAIERVLDAHEATVAAVA
ncbi:ATP-binding protein [Phenylobacterium sp.]|uniref:ATP-binding protein n=1 Tax=Phenylobacterium sp. TaxID=1871053 RepID=UPI00271E947A|nr:ATP-binding protein [Phenylobacterium sp.]MDO8798943.1 ATP-binding protein [Phenylobacterium sp.]